MYGALTASILIIGGTFLVLTFAIVANKAWRETRERWRRARRRALEPAILAYAHGEGPSVLPALGGKLRFRDRRVVEEILLDHAQRVRGVERERLGRAIDELRYVDGYLAGLGSRRWWRRADSAERLGIAGATRATNRLVKALSDPEPEVRIRAAKALGLVGGRAAVAPLIHALSEPNRWSTIRIADILAGMKQEVVDELVGEFEGMNTHAKLAALDILGRVRSLSVVAWLRQRLEDEERDVRARACHALGAIGDPDCGPVLLNAVADTEWPVRAMAAKALGRIRHLPAIPALSGAMRDREWWVRANSAEALRLMGPRGTEALDRMLDDRDIYARHQAVLMLEESGILDRQVDLLAKSGGPEREAAESLIRRFVRVGQMGRLRELLETHPDARVREALAGMLGLPGPQAEGAR
ncbi:MAG: HEAT repeat domain-containing protein [Acidobacteriia bacterium]|nr:HEAT repeat domain-containing protein [Terriglobia bacterium]